MPLLKILKSELASPLPLLITPDRFHVEEELWKELTTCRMLSAFRAERLALAKILDKVLREILAHRHYNIPASIEAESCCRKFENMVWPEFIAKFRKLIAAHRRREIVKVQQRVKEKNIILAAIRPTKRKPQHDHGAFTLADLDACEWNSSQVGTMNRDAAAILERWFIDNIKDPYPSDDRKHILAMEARVSYDQVSSWFINARMRKWGQLLDKLQRGEVKQTYRAEAGEDISDAAWREHVGRGSAKSGEASPRKEYAKRTAPTKQHDNSASSVASPTSPTKSPRRASKKKKQTKKPVRQQMDAMQIDDEEHAASESDHDDEDHDVAMAVDDDSSHGHSDWDTTQTGNFDKHVELACQAWWNAHFHDPLPKNEELLSLARRLKVSCSQINQWFLDKRAEQFGMQQEADNDDEVDEDDEDDVEKALAKLPYDPIPVSTQSAMVNGQASLDPAPDYSMSYSMTGSLNYDNPFHHSLPMVGVSDSQRSSLSGGSSHHARHPSSSSTPGVNTNQIFNSITAQLHVLQQYEKGPMNGDSERRLSGSTSTPANLPLFFNSNSYNTPMLDASGPRSKQGSFSNSNNGSLLGSSPPKPLTLMNGASMQMPFGKFNSMNASFPSVDHSWAVNGNDGGPSFVLSSTSTTFGSFLMQSAPASSTSAH